MNDLVFQTLDQFPEPAFSELAAHVFSDYEPSTLLSAALNAESASRPAATPSGREGELRIGVFDGDALVAWTHARPDGHYFHMINSGVDATQRRRGIYSELARRVIEQARAYGCIAIVSRHTANNNAVIIAKLKLGFFVSGFEYSEVYGPLVRLTMLLGDDRRSLHRSRSSPIRRAD